MADLAFNETAVSIGTDDGKTVVMMTGSVITALPTADQVVLTYTVTAGKVFFLEYLRMSAFQTVLPGNSNPLNLGTMSLENPSGTKTITADLFHPPQQTIEPTFGEPLPIQGGTVIRVVCTPLSVTSITWRASFGGYER